MEQQFVAKLQEEQQGYEEELEKLNEAVLMLQADKGNLENELKALKAITTYTINDQLIQIKELKDAVQGFQADVHRKLLDNSESLSQ